MSTPRVDYTRHAPEAFQSLIKLSTQLHGSPVGQQLMELVKQRVSQINGCAFCLDMHGTILRNNGVDPRKLDTLAAWRESPFFDARERAALGWAEALTRIAGDPVPDSAYEDLLPHFDERQISDLTFGIALTNAWNALNVGLHPPLPGA